MSEGKFTGLPNGQSKIKIEKKDPYLHSNERAPYANFFFKALEQEDKDWLLSLDIKEQTDIENCLQTLSDQYSTLTTMDDEQLEKASFNMDGFLKLKESYSDNKKIVDFLNKKVLPIVKQEVHVFGVKVKNKVDKKVEEVSRKEILENGIEAEVFLNDFFENKKTDTSSERDWNWSVSEDGVYINMNINVKSIESKFVQFEEPVQFEMLRGDIGGDELKKFLKGKKVIGIKANKGNNTGRFFLKVLN